MNNEIIVVKQLPVIVEQLAQIKQQVADRVATVTALICTEETMKEVKKARAELNAEFKTWEEKRKEVKNAIMSPYEHFETVYKDCISDSYKEADKDLKQKIDEVEKDLKAKKAAEVQTYFAEYLASKNIDFITYENAGINVTLSASLKSLKQQAQDFIDKVEQDLQLINTFNNSAEILVEYKKSLNVSQAITVVTSRMQAIEDEKKRQEEERCRKAAEEQRVAEVKAIAEAPAPVPIPAPTEEKPKIKFDSEPELTLRFQVTATKSKLRELKKFLDDGGFKYV